MTTIPSNSNFTQDWAWVTHHLVALAIAGTFIIGGIYGVESLIARHDAARASQDAAILQSVQKQLATDEAQWATVQAQLLAQNKDLTNAILKQKQQTQEQQKVDASLNVQDAAKRLAVQTNAQPGEVVAQGNDVVLDLPITRSVIGDIDLLAGIQVTLADTQKQLTNETVLYNNSQADVAEQKTKAAAADKDCKDQIAVVKANARKSKIKYALGGAGAMLLFLLGHGI